MTRTVRVLTSLLLIVGLTLPTLRTPTPAAADPAKPTENASKTTKPNGATDIGWERLGLNDRFQVLGANQPSDISVPVPPGVAFAAVTGQIGSAINIVTGRVDVVDGRGVVVGSMPIPTGPASKPFRINTFGASTMNGFAKLSFVIHDDDPPTTKCSPAPGVTLSQMASTYAGDAPNPRTVADFLPGYVDNITIRVGPTPSVAQQQAALTLVAELTHHYRPIPVRIVVDTSKNPPPPSGGATGRVIEIRDGGPAGMTVRNSGTPTAALVIAGDGSTLLHQVKLFADGRVALAQTSAATVTSESEPETVPGSTETLTFSQLGLGGQISVLETATMYAGFDSSAFNVGSISFAKIHLRAQYTPVVDSEASVLVRAGDAVLTTLRLNESGVIDTFLDVPTEAISSNVGLAFELRYFPKRDCAPLTDRMTFVLDPRSTVTVTPGLENRRGFPVLPMAFAPDFNVAVERPDQVRFAAEAINLMGQQTTLALRPNVTSLDDGVNSGNGLLAVATGDKLAALNMDAPLKVKGGTAVSVDGSPITDVDLNGPVGAIQAFSDHGRMVLALNESADGTLLDKTFDYIRGLQGQWASLSGDVVATGAAGTTVNLTVREGGYLAHQATPGDVWRWWAWLTLGAAAVAALVVGLVLIVRRRRAKSVPAGSQG